MHNITANQKKSAPATAPSRQLTDEDATLVAVRMIEEHHTEEENHEILMQCVIERFWTIAIVSSLADDAQSTLVHAPGTFDNAGNLLNRAKSLPIPSPDQASPYPVPSVHF
jgi:hypothetical protein